MPRIKTLKLTRQPNYERMKLLRVGRFICMKCANNTMTTCDMCHDNVCTNPKCPLAIRHLVSHHKMTRNEAQKHLIQKYHRQKESIILKYLKHLNKY